MTYSKILLSAVTTTVLLSGCSNHNDIAPTPVKTVVASSVKVESERSIQISTVAMPVRKLIKSVCVANDLSWDNSFVPSDKYTVTANYNGNLNGLLSLIKRQTGVSYKIVDGVITLENKEELTQLQDLKKSTPEESAINISWKDTPIRDAFKYFYDHYGYSFAFDLRFTNLQTTTIQAQPTTAPIMPVLNPQAQQNLQPTKKEIKTINFFYSGNDPKEALNSFMKSLDLSIEETSDKSYRVKDYEFAMFDKSVFYDYKLSKGSGGSSSSSTTTSSTSTTASSSASSEEKVEVSMTEKYKDSVESYLRHYLSPDGKLDLTNRGSVIVIDHPSFVANIKKIIKKEEEKQTPLAIGINIVRIDLKDDYKAGVDWNAIWSKGLFGLRDLKVSSSMSGLVNGGFSATGSFKGSDQVISMLQEFGNTKIETSRTINSWSGVLAHFDNIKPIPYIATTSTITGGTSGGFAQGSITPMSEEEGVTLNILPNINIEKNIVDMGIDVVVAEYVGDKSFDLGTNGLYSLPIVTKDRGKFASQVKIGDTIILTGFKVHKKGNKKQGMPWLSQVPVLGSLFGYQGDTDETSEILIMLKVEKGV